MLTQMHDRPVLPQFLSAEHRNAESLQRSADAAENQVREAVLLRKELEATRQEFADYKAQQAEQYEADAVQAEVDKKQQRRHEYLVAAFTVAFTLFLEHFFDIVEFVELAFEMLIASAK